VLILAFGKGMTPRGIGLRDSFADVAQTLARHFGLEPLDEGRAFLP
jgi:phosphopentomutase